MVRLNIPRTSGIYKIVSVTNGKMYIGSACNLRNRKNSHFQDLRKTKHHSSYMQNHVNKYGVNDLKFSIVEFCEKENLIVREQYYIDTLKPQFNIMPIAGSNLGYKFTEEAKLKVSIAGKGRVFTEDHKRKIGLSNKGRINSIETRKKISIGNTGKLIGYKRPKEFGENCSKRLKGVKRPLYVVEKMRKGRLGKYMKEENPYYGKHHTEDEIKRLKESLALFYKSPKGIAQRKKLHDDHVGKSVWNKGLTKETDERVRKNVESPNNVCFKKIKNDI